MRIHHLAVGLATLSLLPAVAHAHPGHVEGASLMMGLAHPVGGADHVLAMLAVGLWAAVTGGRGIWAMPAAFLAAMLGGGAMGAAGLELPVAEPMILASSILIGAAAALALRPALPLALAAIAMFGAAHGVLAWLYRPPVAPPWWWLCHSSLANPRRA